MEIDALKIGVASGKGGTGKTTVAVSLALAARELGEVTLADCDVEEPNDHLFLNPEITRRESVDLLIPQVDEDICTYCGICAKACRFGAIAVIGNKVILHKDLCHGCGLCAYVCPVDAITEVPHGIGVVEFGRAQGLDFISGLLNTGEAMATPVVQAIKKALPERGLVILDAPPGTGCPVIATLKGVDFALLVTEPTPFGLHDLKLAVEVVRAMGIPTGVVISKDGIGTDEVDRYLEEEGIPILLRIPMDRRIAASYAEGIPLVKALPEWRDRFVELLQTIADKVGVLR